MKDRLNQRQHIDAIENDLKTALGDEPEEPMMPLLVVDDPTLEGLQHHLNKNYPYVGLMTDEGAQFLGGFSMKDENRSRTAAGLSSLWGNGQLTILRASKDTIHLDDKRLTVHLMVQPQVANVFLEDGFMVDQGIINRFLIAHPESLIGQRPYKSGDVTTTEAYKVYEARIETLLRGLYRVGEDVPEIRTLVLSEAAVSAWIEFYNEVV